MSKLCDYKDIFGKPNEGVHKYRLFGLATVDLLGLVILIALTHFLLDVNLFTASLTLIVLTIFIHWLFCVPTAFNKTIGLAN